MEKVYKIYKVIKDGDWVTVDKAAFDHWQGTKQIIEIEAKQTERVLCPTCKQPWKDHDFGVPAPECP
jgi:hypothetical protein